MRRPAAAAGRKLADTAGRAARLMPRKEPLRPLTSAERVPAAATRLHMVTEAMIQDVEDRRETVRVMACGAGGLATQPGGTLRARWRRKGRARVAADGASPQYYPANLRALDSSRPRLLVPRAAGGQVEQTSEHIQCNVLRMQPHPLGVTPSAALALECSLDNKIF